MRIGVLADIHGHVANLRKAIDRLHREQVEQFVVLGDIIFDRTNADETIALLQDCGAVGVWGNHELGLCVDVDEELRDTYSASVIDYFSGLNSHYERGDLLFSHTLPNQDALDPAAYYLGPAPDDADALAECFDAFPHRIMLVGHFHRWFAANRQGPIDWQGEQPLPLSVGNRYFLVINAVMNGWAALVDDQLSLLKPIKID